MLHTGGPLALVLGFILVAFVLSVMMQCLGEMAVVLPTSGSFTRYATRFFDPSLGFAIVSWSSPNSSSQKPTRALRLTLVD